MDWYQIIEYLKGECNISKKEEIERWINVSEESKIIYSKLKEIWDTSEQIPENINTDLEKAWRNIQLKTGIKAVSNNRNIISLIFKQLLKVAAVALILIGIGTAFKVFSDKYTFRKHVAAGECKKEVLLADGTSVMLNCNSQITFTKKFKGSIREVELKGEAFFEVSKDSLHPFIVHAGETEIEVLGTSFNIKAKDSSLVMVSVLSGKVAFSPEINNSGILHLEKGERGSFNMKTQELQKSAFQDENFLAWKTGILRFNSKTLGEVVKILSEYYSKTIIVHPELQNRIITVSFDNQSLSDALKILELTLNINIASQGKSILLYPNPTIK